ncbi:C-type mannose receptor 2-like [Lineus longissimus]|uniref:C-type mannose receptor 2-like n=1 Tax=Lineus longissimus TaxID=88925 RepID=UPI002B4F6A5C
MHRSSIFVLLFAACFFLLAEASKRSKRAVEVCPLGYTLRNDICYKLFTISQTFNNARSTCQADGGDLVSITDQETHDWVVTNFQGANDFIFIGFTDAVTEGTWVWADGTEDNGFNKWGRFAGRQLPDFDDKFNCAGISSQTETNGDWLDGKCSSEVPFVCSSPRIQWSCKWDLRLYGDKCYKLVKGRKTWEQAKQNCEAMGAKLGKTGTLASIPDQGTQDFVTGLMAGRRWAPWVGASDAAVEGTWTWTDGTTFSYNMWTVMGGVQQPAGGVVKNCAAIEGVKRGLFGGWNDFKCTMRTWSVCQVGANEVVAR